MGRLGPEGTSYQRISPNSADRIGRAEAAKSIAAVGPTVRHVKQGHASDTTRARTVLNIDIRMFSSEHCVDGEMQENVVRAQPEGSVYVRWVQV